MPLSSLDLATWLLALFSRRFSLKVWNRRCGGKKKYKFCWHGLLVWNILFAMCLITVVLYAVCSGLGGLTDCSSNVRDTHDSSPYYLGVAQAGPQNSGGGNIELPVGIWNVHPRPFYTHHVDYGCINSNNAWFMCIVLFYTKPSNLHTVSLYNSKLRPLYVNFTRLQARLELDFIKLSCTICVFIIIFLNSLLSCFIC